MMTTTHQATPLTLCQYLTEDPQNAIQKHSFKSALYLTAAVISAIAAYTKATINSATRYIVTNKQVTGEETVKNDALPEIPPLEGRVNASYKFLSGKLIPNASIRIVNQQDYTSKAFEEPLTPGYCLFDVSINYNPIKYVNLTAGINNLLNKAYYEHLNRKIIGSTDKLYEPGRVIFVKLILSI